MNNETEGFSLIFILMALTSIMVCITHTWMITLCNYQVSLQRLRYQQNLQSADALLAYGAALAKANFDFLCERVPDKTELIFQAWPGAKAHQSVAKLDLMAQSSKIIVHAHLTTTHATINLSCSISKQRHGNQELFLIEQWSID